MHISSSHTGSSILCLRVQTVTFCQAICLLCCQPICSLSCQAASIRCYSVFSAVCLCPMQCVNPFISLGNARCSSTVRRWTSMILAGLTVQFISFMELHYISLKNIYMNMFRVSDMQIIEYMLKVHKQNICFKYFISPCVHSYLMGFR